MSTHDLPNAPANAYARGKEAHFVFYQEHRATVYVHKMLAECVRHESAAKGLVYQAQLLENSSNTVVIHSVQLTHSLQSHHHVRVTAVLQLIHHPINTCSVAVLWGPDH